MERGRGGGGGGGGCSAEQPDQGGGGSSGWLLISRASLAPRLAAECPTVPGRPEGLAVPVTKFSSSLA